MPSPTVQTVLDYARGWLSDNITVSAGELFPNSVLLAVAFPTAYREMWDAMGLTSENRVRRHFYYNLPAYTSELRPVPLGLIDLDEPERLEERGSLTTVAITSTDTATPINVTATAHGLSTNGELIISGVANTQSPWGRWYATVSTPNIFSLNGSVSDGVSGTGGIVTTSADKFTDLKAVTRLDERDISDRLLDYVWEESVFRFRGASATRQLRVTYIASGNPPTNTSTNLAIDDCLNFLGCRTAGLAAMAKGWNTMADRLNKMALGERMDPYDPGGFLRSFIHLQVLNLQRKQYRRGPFRIKRSDPKSLIW